MYVVIPLVDTVSPVSIPGDEYQPGPLTMVLHLEWVILWNNSERREVYMEIPVLPLKSS